MQPLAGAAAGELPPPSVVARKYGGGVGLKCGGGGTPSVPELPQILRDVPQISQAAKQHLTFAALKEYDSREADGENRESGKPRGGETKATQSAGCHQNS